MLGVRKFMDHGTRRFVLLFLALALWPLVGCSQVLYNGTTLQQNFGDTLEAKLAQAAAKGKTEEIRRLIAAGAKVNAVAGRYNLTPLAWALTARNTTGMRALLEAGADPNARIGQKQDEPLIWWAASQEVAGPTKLLLEFKADPNAAPKSAFEYAPLMKTLMAPGALSMEIIRALVQAGANINVTDSIGAPFVVDTANKHEYDLVLYALDKGANQNLEQLAWSLHRQRTQYGANILPERDRDIRRVEDRLRAMGVVTPDKPPPLRKPS